MQLFEGINRQDLQAFLKKSGIPTMVYYARPMHKQKAFKGQQEILPNCSITEILCDTVLSLPMGPFVSQEDVKHVAKTLRNYLRKSCE